MAPELFCFSFLKPPDKNQQKFDAENAMVREIWTSPTKLQRSFGLWGKYVSAPAWTATSSKSSGGGPFKFEFKYKWICLGRENPSRRRSELVDDRGKKAAGQSWTGQSSVRRCGPGLNNSGMNSNKKTGKTLDKLHPHGLGQTHLIWVTGSCSRVRDTSHLKNVKDLKMLELM